MMTKKSTLCLLLAILALSGCTKRMSDSDTSPETPVDISLDLLSVTVGNQVYSTFPDYAYGEISNVANYTANDASVTYHLNGKVSYSITLDKALLGFGSGDLEISIKVRE